MKIQLFKQLFLKKKLTFASLCHKDFKKHLFINQTLKNSSEYICRQLKQHQYKTRSKTSILLEITLNSFKCLTVSLVPIHLLPWQQPHFCFLQLASSACLCLWCQICTFYCPLGKKKCTLLPESTDVHVQQHIHQKDLNLCLQVYYYSQVIIKLEKTQTRKLSVFMVPVI